MPLRRAAPLRYPCRTLSDTLDGTQADPGCMSSLQNLIPDPTTMNAWICRPAAQQLSAFASFSSPGFVSCLTIEGTVAYGMIASARNAGKDEPFAYDLVGGSFITITGITNANTPVSPPSSGAWTPPQMSLVGTKLVVTHPGFSGVTYFVGFLDISNPSAPVWSAGNTAPTALPSVPVSVAQFNGRAWYLCNPAGAQPGAYYSDVLLPQTITNATQVLTFDDNAALTVAAGLPLENTSGGVVQSLMVFKGLSNIYQVTGDGAAGTLAKNTLNVHTGTLSPLSVVPTPKGLCFIDHDGLRFIDWSARITDPVGVGGKGVNVPFVYAAVPSRVNVACNANVIRISVQNGFKAGNPSEEYWYDMSRDCWSGPHTFPASMIAPYSNSFIMTPVSVTAKLFQSDVYQTGTSGFTENGAALSWEYKTAVLPDTQQMAETAIIESTLLAAFTAGASAYVVQALDDLGAIIGSATLAAPAAGVSKWGGFLWGAATWSGVSSGYQHRQIAWSAPVVFRRLQLRAAGSSGSGVRLGDFNLRYQILGYLQQ